MELLIFLPSALATMLAFMYMRKIRALGASQEALSSNGKIVVLITVLISPVLSGALYYYGWKNMHPKKASQANKYSFISYALWVVISSIFLLPALGPGGLL